MAKITINDMFDSLLSIKKDITDIDTSTRLRIANMLNYEIYELNKSIMPDYSVTNYDFTTSQGIQRYSLPSDFEDIKALNCGLFTLNSDGTLGTQQQEGYNGANTGFYFGGEIVGLVYTPSLYFVQMPQSTQTYRLRYTKALTELTSLASELLLDKRFIELARNYALKEYAIFDEDPAKEQLADQRYRLTLSDYIKNARQTPSVYEI